jgi:hypothetical protein
MTKRDLERIAFVTRQFDRMRATFVVACLCPLVLIMLAWKAPPKWDYFAWVAASLLILWLVQLWTIRRFGRVVSAEHLSTARRWLNLLMAFAGGQLWKVDNQSFAFGVPSLALMYVGAFFLWGALRDWPFRRYRLVIPGFAFAAALAHMGVASEAGLQQWRTVWCSARRNCASRASWRGCVPMRSRRSR